MSDRVCFQGLKLGGFQPHNSIAVYYHLALSSPSSPHRVRPARAASDEMLQNETREWVEERGGGGGRRREGAGRERESEGGGREREGGMRERERQRDREGGGKREGAGRESK